MIMNQYKRKYDLLPSAVRTDHITGNQVLQYNAEYRGLRLTINISAFTGTSITFTIVGVDPISGLTYTLLASAAKSAAGLFTLLVAPAATAAANVAVVDLLPEQWKLVPSGVITSVTYSVRAELIP